MRNHNHAVCAIILAAGTSTRMGQLKQLLPIDNQTILSKTIDGVLTHPFEKVYTVIGHEAGLIQKVIQVDDPRFKWLYNSEYKKGQSTSLKLGLKHALQEYSHVLIFLGDLPLINKETIALLMETSTKLIGGYTTTFLVRPTYKEVIGHPVFLGHMTLELTNKIHNDQGIKSIRDDITEKIMIPVKDFSVVFDIDTPADYEQLKKYF